MQKSDGIGAQLIGTQFGAQSQPNLSLVRQWRIQGMEKGLEKAREQGRRGFCRFIEKEIQIQKMYAAHEANS